MLRGKTQKTFLVQLAKPNVSIWHHKFRTIFKNYFLVSLCGLKEKSHYNSRVSLRGAPTNNYRLITDKNGSPAMIDLLPTHTTTFSQAEVSYESKRGPNGSFGKKRNFLTAKIQKGEPLSSNAFVSTLIILKIKVGLFVTFNKILQKRNIRSTLYPEFVISSWR